MEGIEKFYIPHSYQREWVIIPPEARIEAQVTDSGRAHVTEMLVDDKRPR